MSKMYLGVDIGGTAVKLGLVDENGQVVSRAERSVSFDGYKTPILDTVTAAIRDFIAPHDAPELAGLSPLPMMPTACCWAKSGPVQPKAIPM